MTTRFINAVKVTLFHTINFTILHVAHSFGHERAKYGSNVKY